MAKRRADPPGPRSGAPPRRRIPLLGLALLFPLLGPPPELRAQEDWRAVAREFAGAWSTEDTRALQELLATSVRLHLEGREYVGVSPRQVTARIERVFQTSSPARPTPTRSGGVDGGRARAFAEYSWSPVGESGERRTFTLFLGFRLFDDRWRVAELRLLR